MARIYTSRQLLDPSLISMANQAMQNRLAQDSARRKNVIDAWSNVGTTAGSAFDDWRARQAREDKLNAGIEALRPKLVQKQKYENNPMFRMVMKDNPRFAGDKAYFSNQKEVDEFNRQITDPAFIAAADEFIRTGTSSPLGNLVLQRQAAEARKQAAADALAERKAKENALRIAETNAAQETYAKLQKDMLDALDAGKTQDAAIKQKALEALEKKYINEDGTSPFGDTAASIKLAREEEIQNRKEAEEKENNRLLDVANFLAGLPTTYKNDDDKKPIIEAINKSETLNAKEKADAINKVLGIESGKTANKKAVQSAVAGKAGEKAGKAIDEVEAGKALAKKAAQKKAAGYRLTKSEQDALDKYGE